MARGWEAGGHPAKIRLSAFPEEGALAPPPPPSLWGLASALLY